MNYSDLANEVFKFHKDPEKPDHKHTKRNIALGAAALLLMPNPMAIKRLYQGVKFVSPRMKADFKRSRNLARNRPTPRPTNVIGKEKMWDPRKDVSKWPKSGRKKKLNLYGTYSALSDQVFMFHKDPSKPGHKHTKRNIALGVAGAVAAVAVPGFVKGAYRTAKLATSTKAGRMAARKKAAARRARRGPDVIEIRKGKKPKFYPGGRGYKYSLVELSDQIFSFHEYRDGKPIGPHTHGTVGKAIQGMKRQRVAKKASRTAERILHRQERRAGKVIGKRPGQGFTGSSGKPKLTGLPVGKKGDIIDLYARKQRRFRRDKTRLVGMTSPSDIQKAKKTGVLATIPRRRYKKRLAKEVRRRGGYR